METNLIILFTIIFWAGLAVLILLVAGSLYLIEQHIDAKIAEELNWKQSSVDASNYKTVYPLGQLDHWYAKSYIGNHNSKSFKLLKFTNNYFLVEIESDFVFNGVKIITPDLVFMFPYENLEWQQVSLESVEFNKFYKTYSKSSENAFHDLDPDTISRLMDLRQHLTQTSIQAEGKTVVFVFAFLPPIFYFSKWASFSYSRMYENRKQFFLKLLGKVESFNNSFN